MAGTSVILGAWGNYVNLNSGSGSTNWRGYFVNGARAAAQIHDIPAPAAKGTSNEKKIFVMAMGMDLGGYNEAGDFRFQIWNQIPVSGKYPNVYYSDRIRTANDGTAVDVSRKYLDIYSGTRDNAIDGGIDGTYPPILYMNNPGTTDYCSYMYGFYNTSGYSVSFQEQALSGVPSAYRDTAGTSSAGSSFDLGVVDTGKVLMGRIYYISLPDKPTINSVNAGVRSITVTFTPPTDNGGDNNVPGSAWSDNTYGTGNQYVGLRCAVQVSTTSNFSSGVSTLQFVNGATGGTISGLADGTTYYVRMYAVNAATDIYGETSAYTTWPTTVTTTPKPAFTSLTLPTTSIYGIATYGLATATNVSSFSAVTPTGGTGLPSGVTVNSAGVLSGTPTQLGTFTYAIRATGPAGYTDTATQTLYVYPSGPWVVTNKDTSPITKIRGTVKVRVNDAWVNGIMKVYDTSSTAVDGSYWHPIT